jgi:hypothetical protein
LQDQSRGYITWLTGVSEKESRKKSGENYQKKVKYDSKELNY